MSSVIYDQATGTISSYNPDEGYGFATTLDLDDNSGLTHDIFFHISDIEEGRVQEGWRLQFDVAQTSKGYKARNIQIISKGSEKEESKSRKRKLRKKKSAQPEESRDPLAEIHSANSGDDSQDDEDSDSGSQTPFADGVRGSKNDLL